MISIGIVGGTGYTGVELIRLLSQHPQAQLTLLTSRSEAGRRVDEMFPTLRGVSNLVFSDLDENELANCDMVFFATPHGVAMQHAKFLVENNTKVIDLAADFRLKDTAIFEKWYKMPHACPDILATSVYGLSEINRDKIANAKVVGNPGCYPTTVELGLAPLIKHKLLEKNPRIIIDAKSGVSGAGRKAALGSLYAEVADSLKAYGVAGHRHQPEIVETLSNISEGSMTFDNVIFVPHLVPMIRGMLSTIYVDLNEQGKHTDIQQLYEDFYQNDDFIDIMSNGSSPDTRSVRGSNRLRIAIHSQANQLIILVAQDNLVKGAAGQAIQNMNLMFGLDETLGLTVVPLVP